MIRVFCDRCGKELNDPREKVAEIMVSIGTMNRIDFCKEEDGECKCFCKDCTSYILDAMNPEVDGADQPSQSKKLNQQQNITPTQKKTSTKKRGSFDVMEAYRLLVEGEGMSLADISRKLGVKYGTLWHAMNGAKRKEVEKRYKAAMQNQHPDDPSDKYSDNPAPSSTKAKSIDTGKIFALRGAGWDAAKIADDMGLEVSTVQKALDVLQSRQTNLLIQNDK